MNRTTHADAQLCPGATLADLDRDHIATYRAELERRRPAARPLRASDRELLRRVGALTAGDPPQPTLTGILFFGRDPQRFCPSFTITFLHFAGTTTTPAGPDLPLYLDNREFRGTLPALIDAARAAILAKTTRQAVVEGYRRQDLLEYPEFATREAVVNAVAHRDYTLEGSFIQVRLFSDRLEVQSPGGLGGHVTVDNIAYEQYTRNPHIVRLLEDYGYVEHRGLGVDLMIRAMADAGREAPVFENRGTSFWVTLQGRPPVRRQPDLARLGLNDRQVRAVSHLMTYGRITNREYQELFGIAERTALYDLQGLVEAGLALPVSSGRGRYYILKD
jgi:ATP-dependent DNA helicase RecG